MIEQSLFGDDRIKHLQRPARLRSLPSLVAYDKGGEVGLWYLPSDSDHDNQGFEIEVPKLVIIKAGEAPVDAFERAFQGEGDAARILAERSKGPDCGADQALWRIGSEAGLVDDLKAVLRHTARKAGIDLDAGEVMMFCRTGTPAREPSLDLGVGEIVFTGACATFRAALLPSLHKAFERLWPAMAERNYPVGCSCKLVDRHRHFDIRFVLLLQLSPMTAHETMEEEARYKELEGCLILKARADPGTISGARMSFQLKAPDPS